MNSDEKLKIPQHVAIIVDGNGRWAKERGLPRIKGHDAGFENLRSLSKYIMKRGVEVLSLYVFSTENFKRDKAEVDHLMYLFETGFKKHMDEFMKQNVKMIFSGRDDPLPVKVQEIRDEAIERTKNNTGGIVNFCLNYGGRAEIVDAAKRIAQEAAVGELKAEDLDEQSFEQYLYHELPPVDLMIRTSGEQRLSNFLLWQNSYAEFYFPEKKFPEFKEEDFEEALRVYTSRDRRFGGIKK